MARLGVGGGRGKGRKTPKGRQVDDTGDRYNLNSAANITAWKSFLTPAQIDRIRVETELGLRASDPTRLSRSNHHSRRTDSAAFAGDAMRESPQRLAQTDLPSKGQQAGQAQQEDADPGQPVPGRPEVVERSFFPSRHAIRFRGLVFCVASVSARRRARERAPRFRSVIEFIEHRSKLGSK